MKYDGDAGTIRAFPGFGGGRGWSEKSISEAAMADLRAVVVNVRDMESLV